MKSDTKSLSAVERLFSHSFGVTDTRGQTRQNDMAFKSDWQHKNNLLNLIMSIYCNKDNFHFFNEGLWAERLVSWVKRGVGSPISSPARALAQDSVRSATQIKDYWSIELYWTTHQSLTAQTAEVSNKTWGFNLKIHWISLKTVKHC